MLVLFVQLVCNLGKSVVKQWPYLIPAWEFTQIFLKIKPLIRLNV